MVRETWPRAARAALLVDPLFDRIEAVGAEGHVDELSPFLGVSRVPVPGDGNDHFDRF